MFPVTLGSWGPRTGSTSATILVFSTGDDIRLGVTIMGAFALILCFLPFWVPNKFLLL